LANVKGLSLTGPDGLLKQLTKTVLETELNEEMTEHLGYEKCDPLVGGMGNIRNGTRVKTVLGDGRLRVSTGEVAPVVETRDPQRFQAECVEAFVASWTARGFAESTIANDVGVLERMLAALGRRAWEVSADDVDRVVGELASSGRAVSTRRNYLQVFKGFHRFLEVRKAAEIEAALGPVGVSAGRVQRRPPRQRQLANRAGAADAGAGGRVLRLPHVSDRDRPQVCAGRPGLRAVPHVVSRRVEVGRSGDARPCGRALGARPVRQAACAVR
jgi:Transposase, Mutator family